jgi:hypothetical protein
MSDIRAAEPPQGDLFAFSAEAYGHIAKRAVLMPAVLLLLVLTISNIVILLDAPPPGAAPGLRLLAAAAARIVGLLVLSVALLRIAASSERPPYRIDGAFLLYIAGVALSLGLGVLLAFALGEPTHPATIALRSLVTTVLLAPLAPWMVAIAVAVPLAWDARRFVRDLRLWLPHLLLWSLLLVTPMAVLHAVIDVALLAGAGAWFWPAALFDGPLSTLMMLTAYGLNVAAYRRVALS